MVKPLTPASPAGLTRHLDAVHLWAARKSGDPHLADDIVQETALAALTRLDSLRDPRRLRRWLFRIAERRLVDARRRRPPFVPLKGEPLAPSEPAGRALPERVLLRRMIRRLPLFLRLPVRLHYLQGRPIGDVAAELATSKAAIKARLYRARRIMRRRWERT